MHGSRLGSSLLVNAEVDSMGGIIDGGLDNHTKSSPQRAAFDRAQWDLRLEYDVREERRKELEFLEKGGDPLDFKFELAAWSGPSTSLMDHLPGQFVTSVAKNRFALAASPRGYSVGIGGRLGTALAYEANSADNFDGHSELIEIDRMGRYPGISVAPPEHSPQYEGSQRVRDLEEPTSFQPKKAYGRRYRPRLTGAAARSSSPDIASFSVNGCSLPICRSIIKNSVVHETLSDVDTNGADITINESMNGGLSEDKCTSKSRNMQADVNIQNTEAVAEAEVTVGLEDAATMSSECPPCSTGRDMQNEDLIAIASNSLDCGSSCNLSRVSIDGNGNTEHGLYLKHDGITGEAEECKDYVEKTSNSRVSLVPNERGVANILDSNGNTTCYSHSHKINGFLDKMEVETSRCRHSAQDESDPGLNKTVGNHQMEFMMEMKKVTVDVFDPQLKICVDRPEGIQHSPAQDLANNCTSDANTALTHHFEENQVTLNDEEQKDHILEEARIIEAKRQSITELSLQSQMKEYCFKSHWDFVLEEMNWLANDFAQERIWKVIAAAQIGEQAAYASRLKSERNHKYLKLNVVAHTIAKAVLEFWCSAELLLEKTDDGCGSTTAGHDTLAVASTNETNIRVNEIEGANKDQKNCGKSIWRYAVRFLQHNSSLVPLVRAGCVASPEDLSMTNTPEVAYENLCFEENLFYVVPNGSTQVYRRSIETYATQFEGKNLPEVYEALSDNDYKEDGENMHFPTGAVECSKAPELPSKIKKTLKVRLPRSYGVGGDFRYDSKSVTSKSIVPNGLNTGSIPTKRVRTASRQRVGSFTGGAVGILPAVCSEEASSSGDTSSFQDGQGSRRGGCLFPKGSEVESKMDFEKQLAFDSSEIPGKPKKRKKVKHQGMLSGQRWELDPCIRSVQRDKLKRLDIHQYGTNGSNGLYGSLAKKIKLTRSSLDNSLKNTTGFVASLLASQMSNVSNSSKLARLIGGCDRGRRVKGLKTAVQSGSGSPWSTFEDQALVVLVHDMGPNWGLVSDTINSSLQIKCIFRKAWECKERHKALMDSSSGDGGGSAEDSGFSQPYPSTLPGIPKGSARQLFQQLRDPIEEEMIRSHFEKIILVGHSKQHQEHRQLVPSHASHAAALMQALPNNVNGTVPTPLDLCDMAVSSMDVFSHGCHGTHSGSLSLPNQGPAQSMRPSMPNTLAQGGSAGISFGSSLASSPSAQVNRPERRDERHSVPRTGVPMDEQQRIQQYNHMLFSRNMMQPNMSTHVGFPGNDRSVRMIPGVRGMGIMPGMNRSMSMPARPEVLEHPWQMTPPKIPMQALQSQGVVPPFGGLSSAIPRQSNSASSPLYPTHQQLHNHQMTRHTNIMSISYHPHMQGSAHAPTPEQQASAMCLAGDRQLQQRMLQSEQRRQQFPNPTALVSPDISTSLPNSLLIQSQASSPVSVPLSLPQSSLVSPVVPQQKYAHPNQGFGRTPQIGDGGIMIRGAGGKQPRQQNSRQPGYHPPHPQPSHQLPQQQSKPKLMKGMGKGNMLMRQNISADPSSGNGSSCSNSEVKVVEKGEQNVHVVQGQGYPVQPSKSAISPTTPSSQSLPL